jgi:hypothetical protein
MNQNNLNWNLVMPAFAAALHEQQQQQQQQQHASSLPGSIASTPNNLAGNINPFVAALAAAANAANNAAKTAQQNASMPKQQKPRITPQAAAAAAAVVNSNDESEEDLGDGDDDGDGGDRRPWTKDVCCFSRFDLSHFFIEINFCRQMFQEDINVLELVAKYGTKKWSLIGSFLDGRTGKQCRERWHNHLNPHIKKDTWAPQEDGLIIELHQRLGSRWSEIAKHLPVRTAMISFHDLCVFYVYYYYYYYFFFFYFDHQGRTDNSIKNRYNSTMRRVQRALTAKQNGNTGYMQEGEKDVLFQYCLSIFLSDSTLQNVNAAYVFLFLSNLIIIVCLIRDAYLCTVIVPRRR